MPGTNTKHHKRTLSSTINPVGIIPTVAPAPAVVHRMPTAPITAAGGMSSSKIHATLAGVVGVAVGEMLPAVVVGVVTALSRGP